jgi:alkylhydroperoxidase family enzyme
MEGSTVQAVLADLATAPIGEPLRATLGLLRKVTKDHGAVTVSDVTPVLALGVTRAQIEDALHVCFAFNVITRLADTFNFFVGPQAAFASGAKMLLTRGYEL